MLTQQERNWVLQKAYVPEHVLPLMEGISGGEAHLEGGYLFFTGPGWLIFVGFPLEGILECGGLEGSLGKALSRFRPRRSWFIGPNVPGFLEGKCQERETDLYYRLDLPKSAEKWGPPGRMNRVVQRAAQSFAVHFPDTFGPDHQELTAWFIKTHDLPPRVKELYLRIGAYVAPQTTSRLLSARDHDGRLAAYTVVELAARDFSVWVLGCSRRETWAHYASDLLFARMVQISLEEGKDYVHLGLGVNTGIARFKKKWGGIPFLPYEVCGWRRPVSALERLLGVVGGKC